MTKARKVELLYRKAKGQGMDASAAELQELRKYKVIANEDDFYTTRANIAAYVKAVDGGTRIPFYDWCLNHNKADRRRKGSSESEMKSEGRWDVVGVMLIGWLFWGLAVYWFFHGAMSVKMSAVLGAIISAVLFRCTRRMAGFTLVLLPIILAVTFGR